MWPPQYTSFRPPAQHFTLGTPTVTRVNPHKVNLERVPRAAHPIERMPRPTNPNVHLERVPQRIMRETGTASAQAPKRQSVRVIQYPSVEFRSTPMVNPPLRETKRKRPVRRIAAFNRTVHNKQVLKNTLTLLDENVRHLQGDWRAKNAIKLAKKKIKMALDKEGLYYPSRGAR